MRRYCIRFGVDMVCAAGSRRTHRLFRALPLDLGQRCQSAHVLVNAAGVQDRFNVIPQALLGGVRGLKGSTRVLSRFLHRRPSPFFLFFLFLLLQVLPCPFLGRELYTAVSESCFRPIHCCKMARGSKKSKRNATHESTHATHRTGGR